MMISISKKNNPRSQMLKVVMKHLSDKALMTSVVDKDAKKFAKAWSKIGKTIEEQLKDK